MFRILIVEDIQNTLEQLKKLFFETFENSKIDTADNVKDGLQLIENASKNKLPYHAAILDFKLPPATGEDDIVDEKLYDAIRYKMPETFIAHITAFGNDPQILQRQKEALQNYRYPMEIFISKSDPEKTDWPVQLVQKVKEYLHGNIIQKRLNRIFYTDVNSTDACRERCLFKKLRSNNSITHELAELCREIIAHWNDIDEGMQRKIRNFFYVDASTHPIKVSLIQ